MADMCCEIGGFADGSQRNERYIKDAKEHFINNIYYWEYDKDEPKRIFRVSHEELEDVKYTVSGGKLYFTIDEVRTAVPIIITQDEKLYSKLEKERIGLIKK